MDDDHHDGQYPLDVSRHLLRITTKTLYNWMTKAGINPQPDHIDARKKWLTTEQLHILANAHKRKLISPTGETLESRTDNLEQRLSDLEEQIAELRRGRGEQNRDLAEVENVLRSTSLGSTADARYGARSATVRQIQASVRKAIELLDSAAAVPPSPSREIVITFQGDIDLFEAVPLLRRPWRHALRGALDRGWHIVHLIRRTSDLKRTFFIVEDVIRLLGARGDYIPLYFSSPTPPFGSDEYVVVPGLGVLIMSASQPGLSSTEKTLSETVAAEIRAVRLHATQLVKPYPSISSNFTSEFSQTIARVEAEEGDRCLVMDGLSDLTVPIAIHEERAQLLEHKRPSIAAQVRAVLEARRRRDAAFEHQINTGRWSVRDICTMASIERYVRDGEYSPHDSYHTLGSPPLTPGQRRRHLEHLIKRLEDCTSYELGLVDADAEMGVDPSIYQTFWLAKKGKAVLLETQDSNASEPRGEIDLEITDPHVTEAFCKYFQERLWDRISSPYRDRFEVIDWLEGQIARIPAEKTLHMPR